MKSLTVVASLFALFVFLPQLKGFPQFVFVPDINGYFQYIDISVWSNGIDSNFDANREVFFLLYTRNNLKIGQNITANSTKIKATNFNSLLPTRFVIHGWLNDYKFAVNTEITAAYLKNGDCNVIVVDWSKGSQTANYAQARYRIPRVSVVVANLVNYLIENRFSSHDQMVLVGHSFGAHTAGLTAKKVKGGKLKAIIGLDPAGPLFSNDKPTDRISVTDAKYVEIIHSNGGAIGYFDPLGHADFYPNYGRVQPGCSIDFIFCPHLRVFSLFAESLNNNRFIARQCSSFADVILGVCKEIANGIKMGGEPSNSQLAGIYYLSTNSYAPFAQG